MKKLDLVFEEGIWSAHDPAVPGVYGLGRLARPPRLADGERVSGQLRLGRAVALV